VNVLRSMRPLDPAEVDKAVVRAQYASGVSAGREIPDYTEEKGIPATSLTDTYVAWRVEVDNWRWKGVPFYLRTGKALAAKVSEINIIFQKPPTLLFESVIKDASAPSNVLTLRIQPDEGIRLSFDAKRPGPAVNIGRVAMEFMYSDHFGRQPAADAYERLLLDALIGDSTLFIGRDEIELAWERITRISEGWQREEEAAEKKKKTLKLPRYAAGTWGPKEADRLLERDGRYWRNPQSVSLTR
jgi:glucose-6-phosphate 1-dehydrogenase